MKTILGFLGLFCALVFLLPLAALHPDKVAGSSETLLKEGYTKVHPIRQEETETTVPVTSQTVSQPAWKTLSALNIPHPDSFSILDRSTGKIVSVPVRDYLYGAVAAELPPSFHPEAMKAQAVAAHTYALYCHLHPADDLGGADLSADPSNWEGYVTYEQMVERYPQLGESYWNKITQAVDEVAEAVLVYGEEPILSAYHSMSGGSTEFAANVWEQSLPYLVPVDSIGDTLAEEYEQTVSFSSAQIKEILTETYPDLLLEGDNRSWIQIVSRSPSGYALTVQLGNLQVKGKELRTLLGLRSCHFTVTAQTDSFLFTTRGYGHGVGLSQYGADYMARQGSSCESILTHYYTGAKLARSQDGI